MTDNASLIVLIIGFLLIILVIFSRCNKWINSRDRRDEYTRANIRIFGIDNISKTEPSTPTTPRKKISF